jgi:Domain of unknown function (DUF4124)
MSVWQIATWVSIFWVGFAWGQIYKWTDRQGNVHFSDNPSHVPSEYRSSVEVEKATPPAPLPTPSADAASVPSSNAKAPGEMSAAPPPKDRLGRGPDYWQQLARYWLDQLQERLQERDRLQSMYDHIRHLASSTRDASERGRISADSARLEKAIAEAEARIKKAETTLHTTLPLEARRLGANPGWLKLPGMTQP